MKELFKTLIKDFHVNGIPKFHERDLHVPVNSGKIVTVIGSRRSGKTYLFFQIMTSILKFSPIENIIYINFEDERLSKKQEDLQYILESYFELYPDSKKPIYFFFDEIQDIPGWEKFVRRVYDTVSQNIFLTGSSSNFLNGEIASSLRGRGIVYELYPLSFNEYLRFNNIDTADTYSTTQRGRIKRSFNKYLVDGGFPEIVFTTDELKHKIFRSYFDVMIYRDIIERYEVRSVSVLKYFIKKSISNTAKRLSVHKLYNELKSQGIKLSKDTLYNFSNYVQDCYLLFLINQYSESLSVQNVNEKKIYCIDNGLANSVSFKFSEDRGRMLENLVFLELKRREKEIYYSTGTKGECDFVIKGKKGISEAIQVTKEIEDGNRERELKGLVEAMNLFGIKQGIILTENQNDEIKIDKKVVKIKPIWQWLLN